MNEPLHRKDQVLDACGGLVDGLFLAVPRLLMPFKPRRHVLDRPAYEQAVDFYIKNGFTAAPESFFRLAEAPPAYQRLTERPYHDGKYQVWSYPTGYTPRNPLIRDLYLAHTNNQTGYLIRWTHGDFPRDTVLCLHGYMLGEPRQAERMFNIKKLFGRGLDAALFITPFHWRRAPGAKADRGIFLQPENAAMTAECLGQTMHDLSAVLHILKDLGAKQTGLIGASLGGYNAALYACLSDEPAFAAMMVPAVNFSAPFGPDAAKLPYPVDDKLADKIREVWDFHSPLYMRPRLPAENILVIASRGDKLCPFTYTRKLCDRWQLSHCHFLTGGHWLIFNNRRRGKTWYQFLERQGFGHC